MFETDRLITALTFDLKDFFVKDLRGDCGGATSISIETSSSSSNDMSMGASSAVGAFGALSSKERDESHRVSARDTDGSVIGGSAVSAPLDASCDNALEVVLA